MKMYFLKYKNMDGRIPKETIPQISILSSSKAEEKRMGLLEMSMDLPGIMTMDLLKSKLLVSLEMDMKNTLWKNIFNCFNILRRLKVKTMFFFLSI